MFTLLATLSNAQECSFTDYTLGYGNPSCYTYPAINCPATKPTTGVPTYFAFVTNEADSVVQIQADVPNSFISCNGAESALLTISFSRPK